MVSFFSMFSPNEIVAFLFGCMMVDVQIEEQQFIDKNRLLSQVAAIANGEAASALTATVAGGGRGGGGAYTNRSQTTTKQSGRSQFDLPKIPEIHGLK